MTKAVLDSTVLVSAFLAKAGVSADKDLLALGKYQKIKIITPEEFMGILRKPESEEKG